MNLGSDRNLIIGRTYGKYKKVFVFDLDGIISHNGFTDIDTSDYNFGDWNHIYQIVEADEEVIQIIRKLFNNGHIIRIWTARLTQHTEVTIEWLKNKSVPYHDIIFGKPYADYYIDDKCAVSKDKQIEELKWITEQLCY